MPSATSLAFGASTLEPTEDETDLQGAVIFVGVDIPGREGSYIQSSVRLPNHPSVQNILDAILDHHGTEMAISVRAAYQYGHLLGVSRVPIDVRTEYRSWMYGYNSLGPMSPAVRQQRAALEAVPSQSRSDILDLLGQTPTTRLFVLYVSTALQVI